MAKHFLTCAIAVVSLAAAYSATAQAPAEYTEHDRETKPTPLPLLGAYVSVTTKPDGTLEFWHMQRVHTANGQPRQFLSVARARSLEEMDLAKAEHVYEPRPDLNDVPDPDQPDRLAPRRSVARLSVTHVPDVGYVALLGVVPRYEPGKVPLLPALAVSPTGEAGTWKYLGKLTGEPAEYAEQRNVWSDGGTILRLPTGRWRIYLNGYGRTLSAIEAQDLEGPWKFVRNEDGKIRELAHGLPLREKMRGGAPFPTVVRIAPDQYRAYVSDQWPPSAIYRLDSQDGLTFTAAEDNPVLTKADVGDQAIKCVRAYVTPNPRSVVGLLSVWQPVPFLEGNPKAWRLHRVTLESLLVEDE